MTFIGESNPLESLVKHGSMIFIGRVMLNWPPGPTVSVRVEAESDTESSLMEGASSLSV
jgi:hypothetical protein